MDWLRNVLERMPTVTPEFLECHEGRRVWAVFEEMMLDAHIQSAFRSRRAGVAGRNWEVVPADNSPKAQKIAEFVRKTLAAIPNFEHALAHLLKAVPYGYSIVEIMWRIDSDAIRIDALRTRRPERFVYDSEGYLKLPDYETGEPKTIPAHKFVDHQHTPYAHPLLYSLYWLWYFKKHAQEMFHAYKHVFPSPPAIFSNARIRRFIDQLLHWKDLSGNFDLESIVKGETNGFFRNLLDFCNGTIAERVLGDVPALDKVGSYEEAKTYPEVDAEIIEQDAEALADTINFQLVRWLVDLNYGPDILAPTFCIYLEDAKGK